MELADLTVKVYRASRDCDGKTVWYWEAHGSHGPMKGTCLTLRGAMEAAYRWSAKP